MTKILYITASIRGEDSVSNKIGKAMIESLDPDGTAMITTRDLAANDLPFQSWDRFNAGLTAPDERSTQQAEHAAIADTLIAELMAADIIVIASPIYNFGVPASVKAWADLVARAGTTFKYTENGPVGLLENKRAYIAVASGGTPLGSDMDHMSPWLKFFLGFLGIETREVIAADGIMGEDGEAKIKAALEAARTMSSPG